MSVHLLSTINLHLHFLHLIIDFPLLLPLTKRSLLFLYMEPSGATKFSDCVCCCSRGLELAGSLSRRRLLGRLSAWLTSAAREWPEIKEKCRHLIARTGKRHRHSVDFRYDAWSYALNFDDGDSDDDQMRSGFSARLPPSQRKCAVPDIVPCA